jgi:hypothetical protein
MFDDDHNETASEMKLVYMESMDNVRNRLLNIVKDPEIDLNTLDYKRVVTDICTFILDSSHVDDVRLEDGGVSTDRGLTFQYVFSVQCRLLIILCMDGDFDRTKELYTKLKTKECLSCVLFVNSKVNIQWRDIYKFNFPFNFWRT